MVYLHVDLLVLLMALTPAEQNILLVKPSHGKVARKVYSSQQLQTLGMKDSILLVHAFSGCDTTSAAYRKGKLSCFKLFKKQAVLQGIADIFNSPSSSHEAVAAAGNKIFLALYNAPRKQTSLNMHRYNAFTKSVSNAKPDLSALPPTEGAARQHAFRVYHQIQFWLGNELPPVQWGWKVESDRLIPVTTEDPAAPEAVLNLICCTCTTGCGNRCGCRKAGIMCTSICHNCHGECLNGVTSNLEEDFDDPDDPDVINLEEADHSVQITNTEHLVHKGQSNVLAGTRSQVRLHICIFFIIHLPCNSIHKSVVMFICCFTGRLLLSYIYFFCFIYFLYTFFYLHVFICIMVLSHLHLMHTYLLFQAASVEAGQDNQIAGPSTKKRFRAD